MVLQGTYRLGGPIGQGAMGVVYEATHARLPGRFAIKFLLPELVSNPEAFARFCREAEILSALRHPNLVQIFDFNMTPDGVPYFVMDLLEGSDLEEKLRRGAPMHLTKVVSIVQQVASALNAAHRRGVVHRDLKPSNIFLLDLDGDEDQGVKVLDFGVSKISSRNRLTGEAEVIGTPHYMAPEQAQGQSDEIGGQSDQFSLAAISYEMLTGVPAFIGTDAATLLQQIIHGRPQPLSRHLTWNADALQKVLNRGLAKDPAMRYDSILHFARAFGEAVEQVLCQPAPHPAAATPRPAAAAARPPAAAEPPSVATPPPQADRRLVAAPAPPDWEKGLDFPSSIDRIPLSPYRALWLAAVAVALAAVIVVKGWTRELPDDIVFAYRGAAAWVRPLLPSRSLSSSPPGPSPPSPSSAPPPSAP